MHLAQTTSFQASLWTGSAAGKEGEKRKEAGSSRVGAGEGKFSLVATSFFSFYLSWFYPAAEPVHRLFPGMPLKQGKRTILND